MVILFQKPHVGVGLTRSLLLQRSGHTHVKIISKEPTSMTLYRSYSSSVSRCWASVMAPFRHNSRPRAYASAAFLNEFRAYSALPLRE